MRDVLDSMAAQISERVSNPVFLPFIISWIVINHKAFLYLISQNTVSTKLEALGEHFEWQSPVLNGYTLGLIYPLAFALAFVVFYPLANRHIMIYWRSQARKAKADYVRHLDLNPLSREEAREIRRETEKKVSESEVELEKKGRQLTLSVNKVGELEELIERTEAKYRDLLESAKKERAEHQNDHTAWNEERKITSESYSNLKSELETERSKRNNILNELQKSKDGAMRNLSLTDVETAMKNAISRARKMGSSSNEVELARILFEDAISTVRELPLALKNNFDSDAAVAMQSVVNRNQELRASLPRYLALEEYNKTPLMRLTKRMTEQSEKFKALKRPLDDK